MSVASMEDPEVQGLYAAVRDFVIPFVTSEWLSFAPRFLAADTAALVKCLAPGDSLGDAYPEMWPVPSQAGAPGHTSSSQSAASSSLVSCLLLDLQSDPV
jgi:hypothetical protein